MSQKVSRSRRQDARQVRSGALLSRRQQRVASALQKCLQELLCDNAHSHLLPLPLQDLRAELERADAWPVDIREVRLGTDMRSATVWYAAGASPLDEELSDAWNDGATDANMSRVTTPALQRALERSAGTLRALAVQTHFLRRAPRLRFVPDNAQLRGDKTLRALDNLSSS